MMNLERQRRHQWPETSDNDPAVVFFFGFGENHPSGQIIIILHQPGFP